MLQLIFFQIGKVLPGPESSEEKDGNRQLSPEDKKGENSGGGRGGGGGGGGGGGEKKQLLDWVNSKLKQ